MSAKRTTASVIEKFMNIHGDTYDYSKVDYIKNRTKVVIICRIHGEFEQTPHNHLSGRGCPKCGEIRRALTRSSNTEEVIKKAREKWGDTYDYSKVNYVGTQTKVTIICRIHGEFEQTPHSHLRGRGCPKCKSYVLKDNTPCASLIEAFYYLKYKEDGIEFLHNQQYPSTYSIDFKKYRYDFYIPSRNEYIEVSSYSTSTNHKDYHKKIEAKRRYVEDVLNAKFTFINRKLTPDEMAIVRKELLTFNGGKLDFEKGLKRCCTCKISKPYSDFNKNNGTLDGYNNSCKKCIKEYDQRPEVKEHDKEYQKEYRQRPENKERKKEYEKEYRQRPENKERRKEHNRSYYQKKNKKSLK